ncbi:hypothetical protein K502DRAFT_365479 [Neoconidiobolus thromboides FSU 785]|nr:hypothetical protein K502DRAFT_365479 [Neoconidiobolus thromboides FSU 785]
MFGFNGKDNSLFQKWNGADRSYLKNSCINKSIFDIKENDTGNEFQSDKDDIIFNKKIQSENIGNNSIFEMNKNHENLEAMNNNSQDFNKYLGNSKTKFFEQDKVIRVEDKGNDIGNYSLNNDTINPNYNLFSKFKSKGKMGGVKNRNDFNYTSREEKDSIFNKNITVRSEYDSKDSIFNRQKEDVKFLNNSIFNHKKFQNRKEPDENNFTTSIINQSIFDNNGNKDTTGLRGFENNIKLDQEEKNQYSVNNVEPTVRFRNLENKDNFDTLNLKQDKNNELRLNDNYFNGKNQTKLSMFQLNRDKNKENNNNLFQYKKQEEKKQRNEKYYKQYLQSKQEIKKANQLINSLDIELNYTKSKVEQLQEKINHEFISNNNNNNNNNNNKDEFNNLNQYLFNISKSTIVTDLATQQNLQKLEECINIIKMDYILMKHQLNNYKNNQQNIINNELEKENLIYINNLQLSEEKIKQLQLKLIETRKLAKEKDIYINELESYGNKLKNQLYEIKAKDQNMNELNNDLSKINEQLNQLIIRNKIPISIMGSYIDQQEQINNIELINSNSIYSINYYNSIQDKLEHINNYLIIINSQNINNGISNKELKLIDIQKKLNDKEIEVKIYKKMLNFIKEKLDRNVKQQIVQGMITHELNQIEEKQRISKLFRKLK